MHSRTNCAPGLRCQLQRASGPIAQQLATLGGLRLSHDGGSVRGRFPAPVRMTRSGRSPAGTDRPRPIREWMLGRSGGVEAAKKEDEGGMSHRRSAKARRFALADIIAPSWAACQSFCTMRCAQKDETAQARSEPKPYLSRTNKQTADHPAQGLIGCLCVKVEPGRLPEVRLRLGLVCQDRLDALNHLIRQLRQDVQRGHVFDHLLGPGRAGDHGADIRIQQAPG